MIYPQHCDVSQQTRKCFSLLFRFLLKLFGKLQTACWMHFTHLTLFTPELPMERWSSFHLFFRFFHLCRLNLFSITSQTRTLLTCLFSLSWWSNQEEPLCFQTYSFSLLLRSVCSREHSKPSKWFYMPALIYALISAQFDCGGLQRVPQTS